MKYVVRVGDKYVNARGLGTRRAATVYEREDAVQMGCIQTCGTFIGDRQREAAYRQAIAERRFTLERAR